MRLPDSSAPWANALFMRRDAEDSIPAFPLEEAPVQWAMAMWIGHVFSWNLEVASCELRVATCRRLAGDSAQIRSAGHVCPVTSAEYRVPGTQYQYQIPSPSPSPVSVALEISVNRKRSDLIATCISGSAARLPVPDSLILRFRSRIPPPKTLFGDLLPMTKLIAQDYKRHLESRGASIHLHLRLHRNVK